MINYLAGHKVATGDYKEFYCPMADSSWLQKKELKNTENPFYGSSMPGCGTEKRTF